MSTEGNQSALSYAIAVYFALALFTSIRSGDFLVFYQQFLKKCMCAQYLHDK